MPNRLAPLLLALVLLGAAGPAPRIESFSPEGLSKQVRQVAVRFSQPMIAFGDPRPPADLFAIDCPEAGVARWTDERSWVYDFAKDLPAGVACRFTLRADAKSLAGARVTGRREFRFTTGGPAVGMTNPYGGTRIAEDQRFALRLDAAAEPRSVEAHAHFRVEGLPDPVGVRVVTGAERDAALRRTLSEPTPSDVVLEARQRFPANRRVELVWGAGIASPSGVATHEAQRFEWKVREPLGLRISCPRENARADCLPLGEVELRFSAPVAADAARRIRLVPLAGGAPRSAEPGWDEGEAFREYWRIRGPFAPSTRWRLELPAELRDDAGRALEPVDPAALELEVAPLPPLAKFAAHFGIVEAAAPVLPVTLRRIEPEALPSGASLDLAGAAAGLASPTAAQALAWLRASPRWDMSTRQQSIFSRLPDAARASFALPPPASDDATEVVGVPLAGLGLHAVEIESRALGLSHLGVDRPMYASAVALVTNLSVHFKWGREGSLAWVTTLDGGRPVEDASVAVFDCEAQQLASGTTDDDGIARLAGLPTPDAEPTCDGLDSYASGLLVMARLDGDVSFSHTSWEDGIELFRFAVPTSWQPTTALAHTLLDRALFRAGETVHMKHVLRRPVLAGFAAVPENERPALLRILHTGSETPVELAVSFDADGSALSQWAIPKDAKLGTYEISLVQPSAGEEGERALASGRFRVEAFRLPLLTGGLQPAEGPLVDRREVPLDVALRYLAGGPARGLEATLRTQVRPRTVSLPDWEGFAFLAGAVREGVERGAWGEQAPAAPPPEPKAQELVLDDAGGARLTVAELPASQGPTELVAELAFRDPNGETQTLSRTVPLWPAARIVGLRAPNEFAFEQPLRVESVVLDLAQQPVRGAQVEVDVFTRQTSSHRKRLVGGIYAYEHVVETKRVGALCAGRTDARGRFACEAPPPARGELVLRAVTRDEAGRAAATHLSRWLPGDDDWWAADSSDRMDLLPDQLRYEPGDVAFVHVQMPFREATALVTVEREGVAEAFVKKLSGRAPWVAVPIRDTHAPNVFVSVLAVRGRTDEPQPTALVDLARPALRLGMTKLRVGWRGHELRVSVKPERDVHRVRETAKVRVRVRTPDGDFPPPGSELAVAAVDEALLELAPNPSWRLLEAMEDERAQEVHTSTAQLQVVGKRHFGQKAVPSGGGGGGRPTRELFDTLLAWRPRVPLDARGEARVEIPLNDSLTSFRIVAIATGGNDRFGTGHASIRTTQELMALAGVPPLAREGDRLRPEFTLRNATDDELSVLATLRVRGLAQPFEPQRVVLGPGEARALGFPVEVPVGMGELVYELEAAAEGGGPADRVRAVQKIVAAVPERVVQGTLLQLDRAVELPVALPQGAVPGRGGVEVSLRPTLASGTEGIEAFFRAYPYSCLEQRASRAIGLRDEERWRALSADLPAYLDDDGLAKFFPSMHVGSEVLTVYLLATSHEAAWALPEASRGRMLDALEGFVDGRIRRDGEVSRPDLALRKLAALEALARHGRDVAPRLAALPRQPELWPTSALLDALSLLRRLAPPAHAKEIDRMERLLRARLTLGGTTLGFSTEKTDAMDWLLTTADLNAVRFVALAHESPGFRADVPRLVKGALVRQRRGAWDTTLANAWGRLALERFGREFEATRVAGETKASLGERHESVAWSAGLPAPLRLPWPLGRSELALRHAGAGAPWAEVRSIAALPLRAPLFAGYTIARRWTPLAPRPDRALRRGDLVRVHLEVDAQTDAAWVVLDDPIPAGASILGSGLGRDSAFATAGEQRSDGWEWDCPCRAFTERSFESYRDYFSYVPKGKLAVEYTLRLDQDGTFALPPTRVEAMYAPESFAELPHETVEVAP